MDADVEGVGDELKGFFSVVEMVVKVKIAASWVMMTTDYFWYLILMLLLGVMMVDHHPMKKLTAAHPTTPET